MTEPGLDLSCVDDLDPNLTTVSGRTALAQAIARRLQTPKGGLFYDPEYGCDVRQFLNAAIPDTGAIAAKVAAQALEDERVEAATCVAKFAAGVLTINLNVTDAEGPFSLTVEATALTVALLTPTF